jgi:hypothetical protein
MDVTRPTTDQIADVVQDSGMHAIAPTAVLAARTPTVLEVATALNDLGLRQIFRFGDAFRDIRQIRTRTSHGPALLGQVYPARNLRDLPRFVMVNFHK